MKWKTFVLIGCCISLVLAGCADKEQLAQYYAVEERRTQAIIDSIEIQSRNNADARVQQMQMFSAAATQAATTESPVDDSLLAFAWGYQMGQPMKVETPRLQPIKAPDSSADLVRAWTPLVGLAVPFLYPLAYGWAASGSSGTRVSADNGATVSLDSGNTGSYNRAGYDMTTTIDNTGNQGILNSQSTCEGEECFEGRDPQQLPIEGECGPGDLETCISTAPAGFTPAGTPLYLPGCSCNSWCAGECG